MEERFSGALWTDESDKGEYLDHLTGLYNRNGFLDQCARVLQRKGEGPRCSVVFLDVHNFKMLNELFGSRGGDALLKEIAERICEHSSVVQVAARTEADHFALLVLTEAFRKLNLMELLQWKWVYQNHQVPIHVRLGICEYTDPAPAVENMLEYARIAKNTVVLGAPIQYAYFDRFMQMNQISRSEVLWEFEGALKRGEFLLYFQPIIDAKNGGVHSAEVLVRWQSPKWGLIPPSLFIPVLEESGLISELDRYVLQQAAKGLMEDSARGQRSVPLSVNLSWKDFYDEVLVQEAISLLEGDVPRGSLSYELTETTMAAIERNSYEILDRICALGAQLLLDDFGAGYSSFGMIHKYHYDILKIDMSFVQHIEENEKSRQIISAIIDMSHRIGMQVIAEGVENEAQAMFLREQGCDFLQGYFFAKPMPKTEFEAYVLQQGQARPQMPKEKQDFTAEAEFLRAILNHSDTFIQVCDLQDFSMVYANSSTIALSPFAGTPYQGKKCYQYMMGLSEQCGHCPLRQMGQETEKVIEVDDGNYAYRLKAKILEWNGRRLFIEYGRNVTDEKRAKERYEARLKQLMEDVPDAEAIFHIDLTENRWISTTGHSQNVFSLQDLSDVDSMVRKIASYIPDEDGRTKFFDTFCRRALLEAFETGKNKINLDVLSYYDDRTIRKSRITAKLMMNPENHIEAVLYGVDSSAETEELKNAKEALVSLRRESQEKLDALQNRNAQELKQMMERYTEADYDRRHDYLTGLQNRHELFDVLEYAGRCPIGRIVGMFMLDLDNFKLFNDTHGHVAGDVCLRVLGQVLKQNGERFGVSFYRYGGEEFIGLAFRNCDETGRHCLSTMEEAVQEAQGTTEKPLRHRKKKIVNLKEGLSLKEVAEALLSDIRKMEIPYEGKNLGPMTASIGYTDQPMDYTQMIECVDAAMYEAKQQGKDRAVYRGDKGQAG